MNFKISSEPVVLNFLSLIEHQKNDLSQINADKCFFILCLLGRFISFTYKLVNAIKNRTSEIIKVNLTMQAIISPLEEAHNYNTSD